MAPDGWEHEVEVRITGFSHIEHSDPYWDTFLNVKFTKKGAADLVEHSKREGRGEMLAQHIADGTATPYMRGYVYKENEDGEIVGFYRGWK